MVSGTPTRCLEKKLHNGLVESSANAFLGQFRRTFLNMKIQRHMGTGHWVLGAGYWVLGTGYCVLGTAYWVL